jgi:hypothetical protein
VAGLHAIPSRACWPRAWAVPFLPDSRGLGVPAACELHASAMVRGAAI